jgi:hypothetical protein
MRKQCSKCWKIKPLTEFYAHKEGLMGRRSDCKQCHNRYHNQWARKRYVPKTGRRHDMSAENRARRQAEAARRGQLRRRLDEEIRTGRKCCRLCLEEKEITAFRRVQEEPPRVDATCKKCRSSQVRKSQCRKSQQLLLPTT